MEKQSGLIGGGLLMDSAWGIHFSSVLVVYKMPVKAGILGHRIPEWRTSRFWLECVRGGSLSL